MVRGNCNYAIKAAHAQDAGATALIVVNNVPGPPMAPGGTDTSITIPVVMVRQDDGALLFQSLGGSQPTPTSTPPHPPTGPTPTKTPTPSPTPTTQPPSSEPGTLDPVVTFESPSTCVANATTLCLETNRFRVRARWTTRAGATGNGNAASLTGDSGTFWFFEQANVELVLKVKNACGSAFNNFWFFAAGSPTSTR